MARSSSLLAVCVLASAACIACRCGCAFLSSPAPPSRVLRGESGAAGAAAAALAMSAPGTAGAFVYNGKEYFDVFF
eukprot:CAMPEP_0117497298 /NCGR_PEP_ID=MMETSP0784-20121206/21110_1 /TAXON_ID=39447 /ORGANISM="" /LENGTH=75 /DNA_ID=CAMNT_0005292315 /DNA_START=69 /DNA_END=293 /DNA_ORIENTATION=-